MTARNKNIKTRLSDFLRYRRGEMKGRERNLFERELQKDPFALEAEEGFATILPSEVSGDVRRLKRSVHKRTRMNQRPVIYRIAASVAVLMIISSVFIIVERDKPSGELSQISKPVIEILRDQPLNKPEPKDQSREKSAQNYPGNRMIDDVRSKAPAVEAPAEKPVEPEKSDRITRSEISFEEYTKSFKSAVPATAAKRTASRVEGLVISTEDNLPVAGASITVKGTDKGVITNTDGEFSINVADDSAILVASFIGMEHQEFLAKTDTRVRVRMEPAEMSMDEIVVVGYGSAKKESTYIDDTKGYTPPLPVNGKADFEAYIQENIRRPDTLTEGQRVVVVVRFLVKADGTVSNIRILRSPAKDFSDEAIRLIKSGPAWKPAEHDGIAKEDEVRVRIVFR